jgi:SAM-dependent methyltransferase
MTTTGTNIDPKAPSGDDRGAAPRSASTPATASADPGRLEALVGQLLADLGGAFSVPLVRIGDRLGLYGHLRDGGGSTSDELAARAGIAPRYAREWLSAQAASSYVSYDEASERFSLSPEQAMVFAQDDSPVNLRGAFDLAAALHDNTPMVLDAFRTGEGVGWGDQAGCLFCAVGKFFRPGYVNNIVSQWLPALDGVAERLSHGGTVADVGCGHGHSTVLMAEAFPQARFKGFDFHEGSIDEARRQAEAHGVADRVTFEVASATDFPGGGYDLVTHFDCLHDLGDPRGAARRVRETLAEDGVWMVVEPIAGDRLSDNLNVVGRLFYSASTMVCVPTSLDQEVGEALGAQAGEARIGAIARETGFTRFRRATETPFNMVLEARP